MMKALICGSNGKHVERNGSGYADSTVNDVIEHYYNEEAIKKEDYEYRKMKKKIKKMLTEAGYILDGPISLINIESGRKKRIY